MFQGVFTALATPFKGDALDEDALAALVDDQFANGIAGVVPVGTTGESPTLNNEEHIRVVEIAAQAANGRGAVIAGTGSNSTDEAIALTQRAEAVGATGFLQVAPYYNKPSPEGLFRHFKAVADATDKPIILYSIPGRCGIAIDVPTVARLAEACPNIVAIKEAGGQSERVNQLCAALPESFDVLCGDDAITLPFMSVGARGVVSVASNLIPGPMSEMVAKMLAGDLAGALAIHRRYYPLFAALLKLDTNPVPIKAALGLAGKMDPGVRLPLAPLSGEGTAELRGILEALGIV
ncbi:MAG: 4-hydroxy-tetrahydrodipicolinate synthase [Verrucomicrobiales bacterium]